MCMNIYACTSLEVDCLLENHRINKYTVSNDQEQVHSEPKSRPRNLNGKKKQIDITSRKHFRTKATPDFHLTYSKNGGNLGSESK